MYLVALGNKTCNVSHKTFKYYFPTCTPNLSSPRNENLN